MIVFGEMFYHNAYFANSIDGISADLSDLSSGFPEKMSDLGKNFTFQRLAAV